MVAVLPAAVVALEPGGLLSWLIVGLIVGQLGILSGTLRFWETVVVAFFGAVVFLALVRLVTRSRRH